MCTILLLLPFLLDRLLDDVVNEDNWNYPLDSLLILSTLSFGCIESAHVRLGVSKVAQPGVNHLGCPSMQGVHHWSILRI
jgi:hypothetical protein